MINKGVILAGGTGSRLKPFTNITNKHLLPVGDKTMIEYPLNSLLNAGIKDIMVITGKKHADSVFNYLGSGKNFGCHFTYKVQDEAKGIAGAIYLAKDFIKNDEFVVILGDNMFSDLINITSLKDDLSDCPVARVYIKLVDNPERFGVVNVGEGMFIKELIEEKPKKPKSNFISTGFYHFNSCVFKIIEGLKLSKRNEYEVVDIFNKYISNGQNVEFEYVTGEWSDMGTMKSYHKVNKMINDEEITFY